MLDKMELLIDRINKTKDTENYIEKSFKIKLLKTAYYSILTGILMYFIISFVLLEYSILKWVVDGRITLTVMMMLPFVILLINTITRSVIVVDRKKLEKELEELYELGVTVSTVRQKHGDGDDVDLYNKIKGFTSKKVVNYFIKILE